MVGRKVLWIQFVIDCDISHFTFLWELYINHLLMCRSLKFKVEKQLSFAHNLSKVFDFLHQICYLCTFFMEPGGMLLYLTFRFKLLTAQRINVNIWFTLAQAEAIGTYLNISKRNGEGGKLIGLKLKQICIMMEAQ